MGAILGYDTRDSWRDPRHGWKNELEIIRSGGAGSFWTMNFDARRYQPTWRRQHVLLSTLVTLQSGTVGQDVPGYLTYYLGGANTIRGYSVEDLGQKLSGKNQLVTTAEYNFNLLPLARRDIFKWSYSIGLQLALFSDLGHRLERARRFHGRAIPGGRGRGAAVPRSRFGAGALRPGLEPGRRPSLPFRERDQARQPAAAAPVTGFAGGIGPRSHCAAGAARGIVEHPRLAGVPSSPNGESMKRLCLASALVLAVGAGRAWPAPAVPPKAPHGREVVPKAFDVPLATSPGRATSTA